MFISAAISCEFSLSVATISLICSGVKSPLPSKTAFLPVVKSLVSKYCSVTFLISALDGFAFPNTGIISRLLFLTVTVYFLTSISCLGSTFLTSTSLVTLVGSASLITTSIASNPVFGSRTILFPSFTNPASS